MPRFGVDPQLEEYEPKPIYICCECGEGIYEDDRYTVFDGDEYYCESCIEHRTFKA